MTTAERIEYIVQNVCHGSAKMFSTRTGIAPAAVSRLRAGTLGYGSQGIGPYFERIMTAFPELDPLWLATGKGNPAGDRKDIVRVLVREVRELNRKIDAILNEN